MPRDRNLLARLMSGLKGQQGPLTFEELLMQERGDRDQAALRFNAQNGGPASTAYGPTDPLGGPGGAPPPPDMMPTGGIPTPTPSPGAPSNTPIPTPRPQEILEDRATRDRSTWPSYPYNAPPEQGQISQTGGIHPTPLPGPLPQGGLEGPLGTASPTPLPGPLPQGGVVPTPAQVPTQGPLPQVPRETPPKGRITNIGDGRDALFNRQKKRARRAKFRNRSPNAR